LRASSELDTRANQAAIGAVVIAVIGRLTRNAFRACKTAGKRHQVVMQIGLVVIEPKGA